ncbi:ABC-type Fe3+-hydroxamate transport system substrate-binding protein [Kribbella aluminosa]|uniref:ABC-type Fe3+-hydroxamate transport system substrate-binding protein n=1 Tax=Kribbella aluminosa TaxID=416017 RepID=A0ABS4UYJ6_9ACTN|nr:helical backbone metal receptor [Kribbella aluminosa]MBP2356733.1 ABC-type Fe3+-hydroxamate transport system substrate-binding protein [Kribbella aluminosa]
MPKILVEKGFRRTPSMPETDNKFLATRGRFGPDLAGSASVVLGNVLIEEESKSMYDDLHNVVELPREVRRVVSIVPSLTESIAATDAGKIVGATDWCTHPADLDVTRVRGTKNPDLATIRALAPDVVLANAEENRAVDLDALRAAGIAVWVTAPTTVPESLDSLGRMLSAIVGAEPRWLHDAREVWSTPYDGMRRRAVIPIWRRPWMALGRDTFAGDLLTRIGIDNILRESSERYPRIDPDALPEYDIVVLPDEPYAFSPDDGPEAFGKPAKCVSGRHLTWYGPSLVEARSLLSGQLGVP